MMDRLKNQLEQKKIWDLFPLQLSWLKGWVHTPPALSPGPPVPFLKVIVMLTCKVKGQCQRSKINIILESPTAN